MSKSPHPKLPRAKAGFRRASSYLKRHIQSGSESRGFAVSRLLTGWEEIAGAKLAKSARPVSIDHGRGGFGATLTLLCSGANAPLVEMQKDQLKERINACYGYSAISRIRITQTSATGFAEPAASYDPGPKRPDPEHKARAEDTARAIEDPGLRSALSALGASVLSKSSS